MAQTLVDDSGLGCFVDNSGATCFVDNAGNTLCCGTVGTGAGQSSHGNKYGVYKTPPKKIPIN